MNSSPQKVSPGCSVRTTSGFGAMRVMSLASLQGVRLVDFGAVNVHLGDELLRELLLRGRRREGDEAVAHGIGELDA